MAYTPDNWVVIKCKGDDPHYRILAGWSGGYTTGTSWRMNSGITRVEETDDAYPADWDTYGNRAGFIRNKQMLDEGKPHVVVAFPGGIGTRMMVGLAKRHNIPIKEYF